MNMKKPDLKGLVFLYANYVFKWDVRRNFTTEPMALNLMCQSHKFKLKLA